MGVMSAIEKAKERSIPKSASMRVWEGLVDSDKNEIRSVLESGVVGPSKLSNLLSAEGVHLGKYLLSKVKSGEV